jgi:hypothetical protein
MAAVMSAVGKPAANDRPSSILIPEDIFETIADEMIASLRSAGMPVRRRETFRFRCSAQGTPTGCLLMWLCDQGPSETANAVSRKTDGMPPVREHWKTRRTPQ